MGIKPELFPQVCAGGSINIQIFHCFCPRTQWGSLTIKPSTSAAVFLTHLFYSQFCQNIVTLLTALVMCYPYNASFLSYIDWIISQWCRVIYAMSQIHRYHTYTRGHTHTPTYIHTDMHTHLQ